LILGKIIKIGLNAPNSISVWVLLLNPLGERSPDPLSGFNEPTSKGRDRRKGRGRVRKKRERRDIV